MESGGEHEHTYILIFGNEILIIFAFVLHCLYPHLSFVALHLLHYIYICYLEFDWPLFKIYHCWQISLEKISLANNFRLYV